MRNHFKIALQEFQRRKFFYRAIPLQALLLFLVANVASVFGQVKEGRSADYPRYRFPIAISPDSRRLVDQDGKPFLYNADTGWLLFFKLKNDAEFLEYFNDRLSKEFSVIQIMMTGVPGIKRWDGIQPFGSGNTDMSQPVEAFWSHVERGVQLADSLGLYLVMTPAWESCCNNGWGNSPERLLQKNGKEKLRAYGKWLGNRFSKYPNVAWSMGGDNDPGGDKDFIREIALGLMESSPKQLRTYHGSSSRSSTDSWGNESWLSFSMTYTYFRGFRKAWNPNQPDAYEEAWREWRKNPARPFVLGESTYEGEHTDLTGSNSDKQARKQAYWTMLGGGTGHAYGLPVWRMEINPDNPSYWRKNLDLPGAASMLHFSRLFRSRPWAKLLPDSTKRLITAGMGPFAQNDLAIGSVASDSSFAMIYTPGRRKLSVNLAAVRGGVKASWIQARNGKVTVAGTFPSQGVRDFEPPLDDDFVLMLDSEAANFGAPGEITTRLENHALRRDAPRNVSRAPLRIPNEALLGRRLTN